MNSSNKNSMNTRAFREFIIPLKKAPLLPLSLSLPLPPPVLAQFYFLFTRKKGILPGLIAVCYELKSNAPYSLQFLTPSPLNTFPLFTIPFPTTRWSNAVTRYSTNLGIIGSYPAQVNDVTRLVVPL